MNRRKRLERHWGVAALALAGLDCSAAACARPQTTELEKQRGVIPSALPMPSFTSARAQRRFYLLEGRMNRASSLYSSAAWAFTKTRRQDRQARRFALEKVIRARADLGQAVAAEIMFLKSDEGRIAPGDLWTSEQVIDNDLDMLDGLDQQLPDLVSHRSG